MGILNWWNSLGQDYQGQIIVGAVTALVTLILTIFIPNIILPLIVKFFARTREVIYQQVAGTFLFNWWGIERYKKNLLLRLEHIPNPWSSQRLLLGNIFVPIKVETKYMLPHLVSNQSHSNNLVDLRSAVKTYQRFVLVGEPGAGKSTALKSIGVAAIKKNLHLGKEILPIFVELRKFDSEKEELLTHLIETFKNHDFPNATNFIMRYLKQGKLLVLLDGLDEVSEEKMPNLIDKIREFADLYSNIRLIVTSRIAAYDRQLDDLSDSTVVLSQFNDIQITTFLRYWKFPVDKSAIDLMNTLRDRPEILRICRNPLLLTIVTSLYVETNYELPNSRSEFYTTCIEAVLKKWDTSRHINRINKYSPIIKKRILQSLALRLHTDESATNEIDFDELELFVGQSLPLMGFNASYASEFINEIVKNSGLLLYVGPQTLRFSHLTFQEYFTAIEINTRKDWGQLLGYYLNNPIRWREVCLLYCGISNNVNEFITALNVQAQNEQAENLIIMAANCVADGELIDVTLAEEILANIKQKLTASEITEALLQALSLMASNPNRVWHNDSFQIIKDLLNDPNTSTNQSSLITVLANIPTQRAAIELGILLEKPETRELAKESLIKLGIVSLSTIDRVINKSDLDSEIKKVCIEICAQIPAPETVDILLERLNDPITDIQAMTAWALSILFQDPSVEQMLRLVKIDRHPVFSMKDLFVDELHDWVWPFEDDLDEKDPEEARNIRRIIAVLISRMDKNILFNLLEKYPTIKMDIRLAIPTVIKIFQMDKNVVKDENFQILVSRLLTGEESRWHEDKSRPYRDTRLYANMTIIRPAKGFTKRQAPENIFSLTPQQLIDFWKAIPLNSIKQKMRFRWSSKRMANTMGLLLFLLAIGLFIIQLIRPPFIHIPSWQSSFALLMSTSSLTLFWTVTLDFTPNFIAGLRVVMSGVHSHLLDLLKWRWGNFVELSALVINFVLMGWWVYYISLVLESVLSIRWGILCGFLFFFAINVFDRIDYQQKQTVNVWQAFLKSVNPTISNDGRPTFYNTILDEDAPLPIPYQNAKSDNSWLDDLE